MLYLLNDHFTSNTRAYSKQCNRQTQVTMGSKLRCMYSTEDNCAETQSLSYDRYLHLPINRPASMAYKRNGTRDNH